MRRILITAAFAATLVFLSGLSTGYEIRTHERLTGIAVNQWLGGDPRGLERLGMTRPAVDAKQRFPNVKGTLLSISDLLADGARFEDNLDLPVPRPLHHFFNPLDGRGLTIGSRTFNPSPSWALEDAGSYSDQDHSYRDARDYLWKALTHKLGVVRSQHFGLLFQTLGQVVHHVQDMAQPQHVRNDHHCALLVPCLALHRPSLYEELTNTETIASLNAIVSARSYPNVYSAADTLTFDAPRKLWTHGGKGIADYTNRGFFSAGTLQGELPSPVIYPAQRLTPEIVDIKALIPATSLKGSVYFFANTVRDDYLGMDEINPRALTESIFDADLQQYAPRRAPIYALNEFNFKAAHQFLMPRAVAYSAGLLNYFFRGQLEFSLPDDKVYALVDTSPAGCGNPCGFRKIKLKLKNTTPGDEVMGPGTLLAVVKYRRNICYTPTLSGDFGGPQFSGNACRSDEYIAKSQPWNVTQSVTRSHPAQPYTFDFDLDPIPLEATDVSLQVVFRGQLGQEADAVAVTTQDIAEPNYFSVANLTDYIYDTPGDGRYHPLPYGFWGATIPMDTVRFSFFDETGPAAATISRLDGGQHAQIAFLTDKTRPRYWLTSRSPYDPFLNYEFALQEFVLNEETDTYQRDCPVTLRRGLYRQWNTHLAFIQEVYNHRVGETNAAQQSALRANDDPADNPRQLVRAKLDGYSCAVSTTEKWDLSGMTPFTPATATAWQVNF